VPFFYYKIVDICYTDKVIATQGTTP